MYETTDNNLIVRTEFDDALNSSNGDEYLNLELNDEIIVSGMDDDILFRDKPLLTAENNEYYPGVTEILRFKTSLYMTVAIALLFWL